MGNIILFFDLDDTVYPEMDYRLGAFKYLSSFISTRFGYDYTDVLKYILFVCNEKGYKYKYLINDVINYYYLDIDVNELIEIFRDYNPCSIVLYKDFISFVTKNFNKFEFGIITDGLPGVQKKKIASLELEKYISDKFTILSGNFNPPIDKKNKKVFKHAMELFDVNLNNLFVYVGDDPRKDFKNPKSLSWKTIRINRGFNNYIKPDNNIDYNINSFDELNDIIDIL